MINNYLKVARRNPWRSRASYSLSFLSLLLGVQAFVILSGYVYPFWTFDAFHEHADRIVRLNSIVNLPEQTNMYAATSYDVGQDLTAYFDEIKSLIRMRSMPVQLRIGDEILDEGLTTFVDSPFLQVFTFPMVDGDPKLALQMPNQIVISRAMQEKYFLNGQAIGSEITATILNQEKQLMISGVVENPPINSSIQFDCLAPIGLIEDAYRKGYASLVPGHFTFLELEDINFNPLSSAKLDRFEADRFPEGIREVMDLEFQPLRTLYTRPDYLFDLGEKGNRDTLLGLFILGFMAMLLGVINHINLGAGLSMRRTKEVALRKVLGSSKGQIFLQHVVENFLLTTALMLLIGLITNMLVPFLANQFDIVFTVEIFTGPIFWGGLLLLAIVLSVLTAIYPALLLNYIAPTNALKNKIVFRNATFDLKRWLMPLQFAATIFFLSLTWIVIQQLHFVDEKELGFDRDHVIELNVGGPGLENKREALMDQLRSLSVVDDLTMSTSGVHRAHVQTTIGLPGDSTDNQRMININYVDANFISTYGISLLAGRAFDQNIPTDTRRAFLFNESAVVAYGFTSPEEAVGQTVRKFGRDTTTGQIIGVMADYHSQSLYEEISPLAWQVLPESHQNVMAIKLISNLGDGIDRVRTAWQTLVPDVPFDFSFLDESVASIYQSERQLGIFIQMVSAILLLISCVGLYAMMVFLVEKRRHEFGVRKILGASVQQLMVQINKQNMIFLLMGFLVATPLAIWVAQDWLETFAYRVELTAWPFAAAPLFCVLFGIIAVGSLTWNVAQTHPIEAIRDE